MDAILDFFRYLLNSEELIRTGGLVVVTLIVFVENGVIFGFFLPGDYLLFLAGVFAGTKVLLVSLGLLISCIFGAAVTGALLGYGIGYFFGVKLQNRPDSLLFKQEYITNTRKTFERYGNQALIVARFLPVVRTFAPLLAGIIHMNLARFMVYNIVGGGLWTCVLVGGGYYFGVQFPGIINYVHWIILFFLGVTTFTVIRGYINARNTTDK
ncbi:DedA family protein [Fibrella forsythiae]|uniref:VTT domain-containing protein n=1 Tax=Fibrella forsythiae TaxID=2817061 RepID=A0ABS3JJ02_9BACT|nr:VTT domain-containing protein [Fibrella forsythiae]MBO0949986.1 VTT domain-containing protein [Fibrella forsythiae]